MAKIFLIEDHDEALKVWRDNQIKGLDLVHIDAHMDFGFHQAQPIDTIFNTATSVKELKQKLEYTLAFKQYQSDLDKQTNIGNYIYPAIEAEIVKDFYWIVPGGSKEFKESTVFIKRILRNLAKRDPSNRGRLSYTLNQGIFETELFGRKFIISTLEKLPLLQRNVLLDIDTDYLVVDSLVNAENTTNIGKRKPWISPNCLVERLKQKILDPEIITIAYSVNGGYTPMVYKHFGDEIAYLFSPKQFRKRFLRNSEAAHYFSLFTSSDKKDLYKKAITLNHTYRAGDNNYGPLYFGVRKFSKAHKEFLRINAADPENSFCLCGLGFIALKDKEFIKARMLFSSALKASRDKLFSRATSQALLGLGQAEFGLKEYSIAKKLLLSYLAIEPMAPECYYMVAQIYEKEGNYEAAVKKYSDTIRFGYNIDNAIIRILKIGLNYTISDDMITLIRIKFNELRRKQSINKKGKKTGHGSRELARKLQMIDKQIKKIRTNNVIG
ncbi:MAG: UPF0489 family protein [Candidatus Omnitrophica bacterium]|nr:UPF0489 family protein [Candidatus Omnitrophota bacterium]